VPDYVKLRSAWLGYCEVGDLLQLRIETFEQIFEQQRNQLRKGVNDAVVEVKASGSIDRI